MNNYIDAQLSEFRNEVYASISEELQRMRDDIEEMVNPQKVNENTNGDIDSDLGPEGESLPEAEIETSIEEGEFIDFRLEDKLHLDELYGALGDADLESVKRLANDIEKASIDTTQQLSVDEILVALDDLVIDPVDIDEKTGLIKNILEDEFSNPIEPPIVVVDVDRIRDTLMTMSYASDEELGSKMLTVFDNVVGDQELTLENLANVANAFSVGISSFVDNENDIERYTAIILDEDYQQAPYNQREIRLNNIRKRLIEIVGNETDIEDAMNQIDGIIDAFMDTSLVYNITDAITSHFGEGAVIPDAVLSDLPEYTDGDIIRDMAAVNDGSMEIEDGEIINNIIPDEPPFDEDAHKDPERIETDLSELINTTFTTIVDQHNGYITLFNVEDIVAEFKVAINGKITESQLEVVENIIRNQALENFDYTRITDINSSISGQIMDHFAARKIFAETIDTIKLHFKEAAGDTMTLNNLTSQMAAFDIVSANLLTTEQLNAAKATIREAVIDKLYVNTLNAKLAIIEKAIIDEADIKYAKIDLANVNNAWIENGVVKDAAISDAQIIGVSANKLTAGTIDASNITVTNLNADNITAGTLNGQRIGQGSLSLDKLNEDVYTEAEVDAKLNTMQQEIDGAIETFTGDVVPTLNNYPASGWSADDRSKHVGDVYYVVNSGNQADGYCYRFTYDNTSKIYSWVLIKDSDVTAALQRLIDAEGDIDDLQTFESNTSSWISNTDEELNSLKSRTTAVETGLGDKVSTSTFNELSQTVDENSSSITSLSTTVSNKANSSDVYTKGQTDDLLDDKADSSTITTLSNTVNTVSQKADQNESKISNLKTTVDNHGTRISTAETTITQHTNSIALKANASEVYTKDEADDLLDGKASTASLELKANKATLTSEINASADTVKINADRVNIEGAAIFTGSGRLSTTSLNNAYAGVNDIPTDISELNNDSGFITSADVPTKVSQLTNDSGYQNLTQVSTTVNNAVANIDTGLGIKWNADKFAGNWNPGEAYFCHYDSSTGAFTDANGWVMFNGVKRTVPKGMQINQNTIIPFNRRVYMVLRLSSATSTTGTMYYVYYDSDWKSTYPSTPTTNNIADWTWEVTTDIVLCSYVQTANELALVDYEQYTPVRTAQQVTNGDNAYAKAANAQTTANNAAPKTVAVKRTQRIYYQNNSTTAPSTPGTASSNWITDNTGDSGKWTKKRMSYSSTNKYIWTCEQSETVSGAVSYTTVLLDDSTTVIDGGNIITGTVTANALNASDINASKKLTVGAMTDAAAATILNSELSDDISAAKTAANTALKQSSWYATCPTEAATAAKVATITPTTTAFVLQKGATVNVTFSLTNSAAVGDITLNVNNTGAKHIKFINNAGIANIPGVGYLVKDRTYQFVYDGTYWVIQNLNYNTNDVNRTKYQVVLSAAEAITSGRIICGTASGYRNIAANVSFDLSYPLLYADTTIAKGATTGTRDNNFLAINGITFSNNGTIASGAANKIIYLKGTITNNTFKIAASPFMTTVAPTSSDGFYYIPLGLMSSATVGYFSSSDVLHAYVGGKFQPISNLTTSYITDIDSNKGITIKPSNSTGNDYLQIDSSAISFYRNSIRTAKFEDSAITLGQVAAQKYNTYIDTSAVHFRLNDIDVAKFSNSEIIIGRSDVKDQLYFKATTNKFGYFIDSSIFNMEQPFFKVSVGKYDDHYDTLVTAGEIRLESIEGSNYSSQATISAGRSLTIDAPYSVTVYAGDGVTSGSELYLGSEGGITFEHTALTINQPKLWAQQVGKATNNVLWSGALFMQASDTISLNEKISEQFSGVILIFSHYVSGTGTKNEDFCTFFIPRYHVENWSGTGFGIPLATTNSSGSDMWGAKYLYIYDTSITGHAHNTAGNNAYWVLRRVLGV